MKNPVEFLEKEFGNGKTVVIIPVENPQKFWRSLYQSLYRKDNFSYSIFTGRDCVYIKKRVKKNKFRLSGRKFSPKFKVQKSVS